MGRDDYGKDDIKMHSMKQQSLFNDKEALFSIFDAVQEGVIVVNMEGLICYINPIVVKMTGVTESEMLYKNIFEIHPKGPLAKVIQTGKPIYDERHQMKYASVEVSASTIPIYHEDVMIGAVSLFRDVTEIISLSAKLKESEKTISDLHNKLAKMVEARYGFEDLIGVSPVFISSVNMAKRAAQTESTVLIRGESGTGKELFASAIHKSSKRQKNAFIKVNCAAIPEHLLESEFFGYEKGAFTGANSRKLGRFELAHRGTIFLDEIGDMDLNLQSKLLRVLEEGEIYHLGGTKPINVNVRVIAATNRDLENMVRDGEFREDLFYRLNVINVQIPPLRERKEDIVLLAEHLLESTTRTMGKMIKKFAPGAYRILRDYNWPGNVRELRNCVERAAIMAEKGVISERDLQFITPYDGELLDKDTIIPLDRVEEEMIRRALKQYGSTVSGKKAAAKSLHISLRTLYNKITKYGIH